MVRASSSRPRVVVRKYGNRRLYRTDESRYVTLEEIAQLVHQGTDFVVQDAKSGLDLTGVVLAQVILEEEKKGDGGVVPVPLLRELIRMGNGHLASFAQEHLPRLIHIHQEAVEATGDTLDMAVSGDVPPGEAALIVQLSSVRAQLNHILDALEVETVDVAKSA